VPPNKRLKATGALKQRGIVYDRATASWQWHMDNDSSGERRPFARVTLTRR